jgi:hypothetical protein
VTGISAEKDVMTIPASMRLTWSMRLPDHGLLGEASHRLRLPQRYAAGTSSAAHEQ